MNRAEKFWIGFGDIHENLFPPDKIPNFDIANGIIISGDITNRGDACKAAEILDPVEKMNPNIYALLGNMDRPEVTDYLEKKGWNIHLKGKQLAEGLGIFGVGCSTPTPFMTPSEVSNATLVKWLEEAYEKVKHLPKLILVAHDPPFGTKAARLPSGENVGNRAVMEFIRHVQPDICLTGHIHEARSEDFIGRTKVLNPGMFGLGGYVLITLKEDKLEAKLMKEKPN